MTREGRATIDETRAIVARVRAVDWRPLLPPDVTPDAWIDESMVVRIVENLLVNAIKHTPPTATIWVSISPSIGATTRDLVTLRPVCFSISPAM